MIRKSGSSQTIHAYKPYWLSWVIILEKVQVGNDQEWRNKKEIPTPQTEGWEKTKLIPRYLYQENIS